MSLRQYIFFLSTGTMTALCSLIIVLINIDPTTAGFFGFIAFYTTLFLSLFGIFSTISTVARLARKKQAKAEDIIKISLRQGFLLTLLVESSIFLLSKQILSIWLLIIFIIVIGAVEFVFLSQNRELHKHS